MAKRSIQRDAMRWSVLSLVIVILTVAVGLALAQCFVPGGIFKTPEEVASPYKFENKTCVGSKVPRIYYNDDIDLKALGKAFDDVDWDNVPIIYYGDTPDADIQGVLLWDCGEEEEVFFKHNLGLMLQKGEKDDDVYYSVVYYTSNESHTLFVFYGDKDENTGFVSTSNPQSFAYDVLTVCKTSHQEIWNDMFSTHDIFKPATAENTDNTENGESNEGNDNAPVTADPVDLTDDMWVSGWIIDPSKDVDLEKVKALTFDGDYTKFVMISKEVNVILMGEHNNYDGYGTISLLYGGDGLEIHLTGAQSNGPEILYVEKGSMTHISIGLYGWVKQTGYYNYENLTEPFVFEMAYEIKYDCSKYDAIKDFLTPIVAEDVVEVYHPLQSKEVVGFKRNPYYATYFADFFDRVDEDEVILSLNGSPYLYVDVEENGENSYTYLKLSNAKFEFNYYDYPSSYLNNWDGISFDATTFSDEEIARFNELKLYYMLIPIYAE